MANGDNHWLDLFWEGVKYVLAALGTVASSAGIWIAARYRGDRAMLLRHEERLNANDKELGDEREFRAAAKAGPIGEKLNAEIRKLRSRDSRIHKRIDEVEKEQDTTAVAIAEIKTQMESEFKWIKDALVRIEKK